jgi:acetylornithine deacetylase/succinyl-diaminopimelate desuccinylase-like protein
VGDDTANVVALLMAAKYITEKKLCPKDLGILLVVNSCEEGLGNLKGCRKIFDYFGHRVREFITFDGAVDVVVQEAVGSYRYRIEINTEGGHSYANFGNCNAIACLASLIESLYAIQVPAIGRTTYNVGTISGGTSVNTIAQHAEMLFEFRSDKREALQTMEAIFRDIIEAHRNNGLQITVTLLGERPCSGEVDVLQETSLVQRSIAAIQRHYGIEAQLGVGSTDCNIPLSMGIPAACVGCTIGHGAHTREEYVEIDSLRPGLAVALELILHHF